MFFIYIYIYLIIYVYVNIYKHLPLYSYVHLKLEIIYPKDPRIASEHFFLHCLQKTVFWKQSCFFQSKGLVGNNNNNTSEVFIIGFRGG